MSENYSTITDGNHCDACGYYADSCKCDDAWN